MRKLLLAASFLAFVSTGLTGCRAMPGTAATTASLQGARPLDNFGEILGPHKKAVGTNMPHGAAPADNFGEIL